jgi:hypothetical protein
MSAAPNCSYSQVGTDGLTRVARGAAVLGRCLRSRKALIFTLELLWLVASGMALVKLIHVFADRSPDLSLSFGQLAVVVFIYSFAFYLMDLYDLDMVSAQHALVLKLA